MSKLPTQFEEARRGIENLPKTNTDAEELGAHKKALDSLFTEQAILISKLLADRKVDAQSGQAIEEAISRLSRYYALALQLEGGCSIQRDILLLRLALENQSKTLALLTKGDMEEAHSLWLSAAKSLDLINDSDGIANPKRVHDAADIVYDRKSGQSKYDADSETWISFILTCQNVSCKAQRPYRILYRHPTHKFKCAQCQFPFIAYFAIVQRDESIKRAGSCTHRLYLKGGDGIPHQTSFDLYPNKSDHLDFEERDLVVLTYDPQNRMRMVRNYSKNREIDLGQSSQCFIASAALDPLADEVIALRLFRDQILMHHPTGRLFVSMYNRIGPFGARLVRRRDIFRRIAGKTIKSAAVLVKWTAG